MNRFVEECQKEWSRLGVPEATANEMAGDLEADLAEAQADGVSPEEVLGNGYFDARSFAASWAEARGLVKATGDTRTLATTYLRVRSLVLAATTVACLVVGALGLAILAGRRMSSISVAAVSFARPVPRPVAGLFGGPSGLSILGSGAPLDALGLLLLVVGLLSAAVTLWIWKPWSTRSDRRESEPKMGLPTYF